MRGLSIRFFCLWVCFVVVLECMSSIEIAADFTNYTGKVVFDLGTPQSLGGTPIRVNRYCR